MITMHPGEYLKLCYVQGYGLSQREIARRLGVSAAVVSRLLAEKADLSPEMAIRLELAFGRSAESWLSMQISHGLVKARKAIDPASVIRIELETPPEVEAAA